MATRNFKITYVVHILFLLDSIGIKSFTELSPHMSITFQISMNSPKEEEDDFIKKFNKGS